MNSLLASDELNEFMATSFCKSSLYNLDTEYCILYALFERWVFCWKRTSDPLVLSLPLISFMGDLMA